MTDLPKPLPVEEALQPAQLDINVPEGRSLTVGPFARQHAEGFRLAEVTTFADLQRLGFIYREITEDEIVGAIRKDDRLYRESVLRVQTHGQPASCSCHPEQSRAASAITRSQVHDHLIDLLQPLFREGLSATDPAVLHPYRHARNWLSRPARYLVGIYALNDINIGDDATLTMTPTVEALYAHNVNIGKNGRLRFTSGGVHVRCKTVNGPNRLLVTDVAKYVKALSREVREDRS